MEQGVRRSEGNDDRMIGESDPRRWRGGKDGWDASQIKLYSNYQIVSIYFLFSSNSRKKYLEDVIQFFHKVFGLK